MDKTFMEEAKEELIANHPEMDMRFLLGFINSMIEIGVKSEIDNRELIPRHEIVELINETKNG